MKNSIKAIVALSILSLMPVVASQAANAPVAAKRQGEVNHRLRRQNRRIKQGVKSGELTKTEAKNLRAEDKSVHQEEKDMRSVNGGKLTPSDKKALNQQENKVSKDIYQEKHDAATR